MSNFKKAKEKTFPSTRHRKKLTKKEPQTIYSISYKLFSNSLGFLYPHLSDLKKTLRQSAIPVIYEAYVSALVFLCLIAIAIGIGMGVAISLLVPMDTPNVIISALPALLGFLFGLIMFGLMYQYPKNEMIKRKSKILEEMAYFSGYMGTLISSGLTLEGIFRTLAKEKTNEEIVKDAKYLTRNLEVMGMDIVTALKDMAERSPVEIYAEFLEGMIANLQVGGDLQEYFNASGEVQLEQRKNRLREANQSLGIVTELYTVLLIVFPLLGAIMLSIMGMMSVHLYGFSLIFLLNILTYLLVPLFGAVMIMMIDSLIPKR